MSCEEKPRQTFNDGRKQNGPKPPGWSWIPRQTGPEVFESSSGEGEAGEDKLLNLSDSYITSQLYTRGTVIGLAGNETVIHACFVIQLYILWG